MRALRLTAELEAPIAGPHDLHLDGMLMAVHRGVEDKFITRADAVDRILRLADIHHPSAAGVPSRRDALRYRGFLAYVRFNGHIVPLCTSIQGQWTRGIERFVRRKDAVDIEESTKRVTRGSGPDRDLMLPIATKEAREVYWEFIGDRREVLSLTRQLRSIGGLRKMGWGRLRSWRCEEIPEFRLIDDEGRTRRHLPIEATREPERVDLGAIEPPYWHPGFHTARVPTGSKVAGLVEALC